MGRSLNIRPPGPSGNRVLYERLIKVKYIDMQANTYCDFWLADAHELSLPN
jgi:hypothetical protein